MISVFLIWLAGFSAQALEMPKTQIPENINMCREIEVRPLSLKGKTVCEERLLCKSEGKNVVNTVYCSSMKKFDDCPPTRECINDDSVSTAEIQQLKDAEPKAPRID